MIMHLMKNGVMSQLFPNEGTKLFSFVFRHILNITTMTMVATGVSIRKCGMSRIFTCNLLYYKNITKNIGLPNAFGLDDIRIPDKLNFRTKLLSGRTDKMFLG